MSRLSDIATIIVGLVRDADYDFDYNASTKGYNELEEHIKVELASLIEDAGNDSAIRKEAEDIMAAEIAKED